MGKTCPVIVCVIVLVLYNVHIERERANRKGERARGERAREKMKQDTWQHSFCSLTERSLNPGFAWFVGVDFEGLSPLFCFFYQYIVSWLCHYLYITFIECMVCKVYFCA